MATFKLPPRGQQGGDHAPQGARGPRKDFPAIPEGKILNVEVIEVELRDRPEWAVRDPEDETKEVSFRFRVLDGEYAKRNLWGTTMPWFNFSPKCRLRIWVQGILGVDELPDDFELKLNDVYDANKRITKQLFTDLGGKHARVLVGNRIKKDTGEIRDFVQDVFPAETAEQQPASGPGNYDHYSLRPDEEPF
jgi:hypothetical protein